MGAANKFKYKLSARTGQAGSIDIIVCMAHIVRGRRQSRLPDAASGEESASPSCAKDGLKVRSIQSHRSRADVIIAQVGDCDLRRRKNLRCGGAECRNSRVWISRAQHNALQPTLKIISVPAPGMRATRRGASVRHRARGQCIGPGKSGLIVRAMLQPTFPSSIHTPSRCGRNADPPPVSTLVADAVDNSPKDRLIPEEAT
jgi:hypothetical protein